jgi:predicted amidohydrolase
MRVAACQFGPGTDKSLNLATASQLIDKAARVGARLIVLPEYSDYLGSAEGMLAASEEIPGPSTELIAAKAREVGAWVLLGSMHERRAGEVRYANTSLLFSPDGQIAARYTKTHLFDVTIPGQADLRESSLSVSGSSLVTSDVDGVIVGLSICYDVRFPELYRMLALRGAKVLLIPAAFLLHTGRDHWEVLVRARAIENQCFVIAAGTLGTNPVTFGRSMIVDPWGVVLATAPDTTGIVVANLDFNRLQSIRTNLPALKHRREDLYGFRS